MSAKIVTIKKLLSVGLIKKITKVKISTEKLKETKLIKPLSKKKVEEITIN